MRSIRRKTAHRSPHRRILPKQLANGILGFPDAAPLALVTEYLYHPNDTVRQYASLGLAYWPDSEIIRPLTELLHTCGPTDVVVKQTFRMPGAVDFNPAVPAIRSDNPVLMCGAVTGVTRLLFADPPLLSAEPEPKML